VFTKEHYEEIADRLKDTIVYANNRFDAVGSHIAHRIARDLMSVFKDDNEKFDTKKFLDAIYGKEKK
jgi:hypothetical protein